MKDMRLTKWQKIERAISCPIPYAINKRFSIHYVSAKKENVKTIIDALEYGPCIHIVSVWFLSDYIIASDCKVKNNRIEPSLSGYMPCSELKSFYDCIVNKYIILKTRKGLEVIIICEDNDVKKEEIRKQIAPKFEDKYLDICFDTSYKGAAFAYYELILIYLSNEICNNARDNVGIFEINCNNIIRDTILKRYEVEDNAEDICAAGIRFLDDRVVSPHNDFLEALEEYVYWYSQGKMVLPANKDRRYVWINRVRLEYNVNKVEKNTNKLIDNTISYLKNSFYPGKHFEIPSREVYYRDLAKIVSDYCYLDDSKVKDIEDEIVEYRVHVYDHGHIYCLFSNANNKRELYFVSDVDNEWVSCLNKSRLFSSFL